MWVNTNELWFVLHLALALVLGAAIGLERQWRQRMAGLRTNTLVSAGAALFVMLSHFVPNGGDETRIAAYVVSGIGFLGAGVIMKEGPTIRGLNTAATLWCSAAIGAASGFGLRFQAIVGTVAILMTNIFLRPVARKLNLISQTSPVEIEQEFDYKIRIICTDESETQIRYLILQAVSSSPLVLQSIQSEDIEGSNKVQVTADVHSTSKMDSFMEQTVSRLSLEKGVSGVSWRVGSLEEAA